MKQTPFIIISVIFSLLVIFIIAYSELLWSEAWILALLIMIPLFFGFIIILISSTIFLIKHRKIKYLVSLLINVASILIIVFCPLREWKNYYTFHMNFGDLSKIVKMVDSGELKPNVKYNQRLIRLPSQYKNLSVGGGEIIVTKINDSNIVFFYTLRGTPDGKAGFVHIPDKISLADLEGEIFYELRFQKKLVDNWFYIGAD